MGNIRQVFQRLSMVASKIEMKAKFANDEHFGYVTVNPGNLGTGLRASMWVMLPKLSKDQIKKIADQHFVGFESSDKAKSEYRIFNKRSLGRNEVELVQDMYKGVQAMIKAQNEA